MSTLDTALKNLKNCGDLFETKNAERICRAHWVNYPVVWDEFIGNKNCGTSDTPHPYDLIGADSEFSRKWGYFCRLHYSCFRKINRALDMLEEMKRLKPKTEEYYYREVDLFMEIFSALQSTKEYYERLVHTVFALKLGTVNTKIVRKLLKESGLKSVNKEFEDLLIKRQELDHWGGVPPTKIAEDTEAILINPIQYEDEEAGWDETHKKGGFDENIVTYVEKIFTEFMKRLNNYHEKMYEELLAIFKEKNVKTEKTLRKDLKYTEQDKSLSNLCYKASASGVGRPEILSGQVWTAEPDNFQCKINHS